MKQKTIQRLIGLSGVLGTSLLGTYFGVGLAAGLTQLPASASLGQILHVAIADRTLWLVGAWLQATGSALSVIFFLGLVQQAKATKKLSGLTTLLGCASLLTVVLIEGAFTMELALAAGNGHATTTLASFDFMTVFIHIYPIAPAPLIMLGLGSIILQSRVLPQALGISGIVLGSLFVLSGLVSLFVVPWLPIAVFSLQALWALVAASTYLVYQQPEVQMAQS